MIVQAYLERIRYQGKPGRNIRVLRKLHQKHIFNVPFENLDIHFGKQIILNDMTVYRKVVEQYRGGFCYELNMLFHELLKRLGFESSMISARIFDSQGEAGPAFDHMCVLVKLTQVWLADVGFGDLFLKPIAIKEHILQTDGRNYFRIEKYSSHEYVLFMSADGVNFSRKYIFDVHSQELANFVPSCHYKQTHPDSYFVKNIVCTKPTLYGRLTVFNKKLIHKKGEQKVEYQIENRVQLKKVLKDKFGIEIA